MGIMCTYLNWTEFQLIYLNLNLVFDLKVNLSRLIIGDPPSQVGYEHSLQSDMERSPTQE